eukprot:scaffold129213_cov39-Phaeocystis_antarctica.AAC.1
MVAACAHCAATTAGPTERPIGPTEAHYIITLRSAARVGVLPTRTSSCTCRASALEPRTLAQL